MKILAIGSEGNIGKELVKHLRKVGHEVIESDITPRWKPNYYQVDINNPTETGRMKLIGNTIMYDMHEDYSSNNYHIGVIRRSINVIQTVIPEQEYVDLSKWIKQTYKIIV